MKYRDHLTICAAFLIFISPTGRCGAFEKSPFDLTIVGHVNFRDGLGRLPIGLTDILKNELTINHIRMNTYFFEDVNYDVKKLMTNPDKTPGNVALLFDPLWIPAMNFSNQVPQSHIKIAYSMLEASAIPPIWVDILNQQFDLVVVPDEYYHSVYLNCGVQIPIFVLPHGVYLDELLSEPIRENPKRKFVFGSTAEYRPRKNQDTLIEAFHAEFGNNPDVKLRLHGRGGIDSYIATLREKIEFKKTSAIEFIIETSSDKDYKNFFKSLDCFVLLSKGEGYSVTPREALALGIPCILTENTAHKTICKTGFVCPVPSTIEERAYYPQFQDYCGTNFNCNVDDVRKALRDVYDNYEAYLQKAQIGRQWVKRYTWRSLKPKFLNLIKPKMVLLGGENIVTKDFLMTSNKQLYQKYSQLAHINTA